MKPLNSAKGISEFLNMDDIAGNSSWERALAAAALVRQRAREVAAALDRADIPYAIVGGNAVAEHVVQVDDGADRNTRDVDVLINRTDESKVKSVIETLGLNVRVRQPEDAFRRGPDRLPRKTVFVLYANEAFQEHEAEPLPSLDDIVVLNGCRIIALLRLVRMKLLAFRCIDRVHIRDLIDVGLIDSTWPSRFPAELELRLQELLDDPKG